MIPPPAYGIPVASGWTITIITGLLALFTIVLCVHHAWKEHSLFPLYLLVGGLLCATLEPIPITLGRVAYPESGTFFAIHPLGRTLPLFVLLSYMGYWTPGILYLHDRMAAGMSARGLLKLYGTFILAASVAEVAAIHFGFWQYYGPQANPILGIQLWWGFIDMHALFAAAILIRALRDVLTPAQHPLITILMPCLIIGTQTIGGLPCYLAMGSTSDPLLLNAGAFASIGVSTILIWCYGLILSRSELPQVGRMSVA